MQTKATDYIKLKEAVDKFGSLQEAIAQLEKDKLALEKVNAQLKQDNETLTAYRNKLAGQVEELKRKVNSCQNQLQSLFSKLEVNGHQYELFCGFMAMVAESPSATDSIDTLITSFQKLKEPGWHLPRNDDEMRSIFVHTVMGDYLKSFRCDACGGKFISNKKPMYKFLGTGYWCPACHNWLAVKEDDSFLKVLVSGEQLKDTLHLEQILEEHDSLLPFKAYLNVPCEFCHEPVAEWDDYNVKLAIDGIGCGHTRCWKSETGMLRQLRKSIEKVEKA